MIIRAADKRDITQIVRLQQQLFNEESVYGFVAETEEEIEKNQYLPVAETGGKIVGFISGKIRVSDGLAGIPGAKNTSR